MTTSKNAQTSGSRGRLWQRLRRNLWTIVLLLSLVVNVFFAAHWLGHSFRPHFRGPDSAGFGRYMHSAPPEIRDRIKLLREERKAQFKQLRRELRALRKAQQTALMTEPFDVTALQTVMSTTAAKQAELAQLFQSGLLALVEELPADERKRLAEALAHRPGPPWKHKRPE